MADIQDSDLFLVNRGGQSYQVSADTLLDKLKDDDLLLVNRGDQSYKMWGADFKDSLGGPAQFSSVVLTESDLSDYRFTGEEFVTTVTMADDGSPASNKNIRGWVEGTLNAFPATDEIVGVGSVSGPVYSDNLSFSQGGPYSASEPATNAFDGSTSTGAALDASKHTQVNIATWDASSYDFNINSFRVHAYTKENNPTSPGRVYFRYNNEPFVEVPDYTIGANWIDMKSLLSIPDGTKLTEFSYKTDPAGGSLNNKLRAFEVNGEVLINSALQTVLTLSTDKDLTLFESGDYVKQDDSAGYPPYSNGLTLNSGAPCTNPENAFDGACSDGSKTQAVNGTGPWSTDCFKVVFNPPIEVNSSFAWYTNPGGGRNLKWQYNDLPPVQQYVTGDDPSRISSPFTGILETWRFGGDDNNIGQGLYAIEIDGRILIDGNGISPFGIVNSVDVGAKTLTLSNVQSGDGTPVYSDYVQFDSVVEPGNPVVNGFDGSESTMFAVLGTTITVDLPEPFLNAQSVVGKFAAGSTSPIIVTLYDGNTRVGSSTFNNNSAGNTVTADPVGSTVTKIVLTRDAKPGFFYIELVDGSGTTRLIDGTGRAWSANTGNYVVGPEKVADNAKMYLKLDSSLNVTGLTDDSNYTAIPSNTLTPAIQFPAVLDNGQTPDATITDGTSIQTEVQAVNSAGIVSMESNVLTPSYTCVSGNIETDEIVDVVRPTYSNNATITGFQPGFDKLEYLFDGDLTTGIDSYATGDPGTAVTGVVDGLSISLSTGDKIEVYKFRTNEASDKINMFWDDGSSIFGEQTIQAQDTWITYIPNVAKNGTLQKITLRDISGGNSGIAAIRINGVILIDNNPYTTLAFSSSKDISKLKPGDSVKQDNSAESQTQPSRLNPADSTLGTISDNGLTFTGPAGSGWARSYVTVGSNEKIQFEMTVDTSPAGALIGYSVEDTDGTPGASFQGAVYDTTSYIRRTGNWSTNDIQGEGYGIGDLVGATLDSATGEVSFYKNGVYQASVTIADADKLKLYVHVNDGKVTANFGATPFAYPVEGFADFRKYVPSGTVSSVDRNANTVSLTDVAEGDGTTIYSAFVTCADGLLSLPANAFDGNTVTQCAASVAATGNNTPIIFAPYEPITGVTALRIFGQGTIQINGSSTISAETNEWHTIGAPPSTITEITFNTVDNLGAITGAGVSAIEVNGSILTDGGGPRWSANTGNYAVGPYYSCAPIVFNSNVPADVTTFNAVKAALESYEGDRDTFRANLKVTLQNQGFTADQIKIFGL